MATYLYARVSTTRQAEEGESLDVQIRKARGYADQHGWSLTRVFSDKGVSGGKPLEGRPQGYRLFESLNDGDRVIASKLDRMFRSASDALAKLEEFKRRQIELHLLDLGGDVTGNGIAGMVFTIMSAVAQFERERIAERVAEMKLDQRRRGRYLGGKVPFGFEVATSGDLIPIYDQQRAIEAMREMREAGESFRSIAHEIAEEHGFRLSHVAIKKILEREVA